MTLLNITREQYRHWRYPTANLFMGIQHNLECVLWDFDIPICHMFAGLPAPSVAQFLRDYLWEKNLDQEEDRTDNDPHAIYRRGKKFYRDNRETYFELERLLTEKECEATKSSKPTPYAQEVIVELDKKDIQQAIVTNNSPEAVRIYLENHDLERYFNGNIFGREDPYPGFLKPSPFLLVKAIDLLDVSPARTLMVGDSVTDYLASKSANTRFLGFTQTPDKCALLLEAGAETVVSTYEPWLKIL